MTVTWASIDFTLGLKDSFLPSYSSDQEFNQTSMIYSTFMFIEIEIDIIEIGFDESSLLTSQQLQTFGAFLRRKEL
jgi:hypothetical protein